jgi:hypothetical protein
MDLRTQRDTTDSENNDTLNLDIDGPTDTGINIQLPTDKKQKTTNNNDKEQQEKQNLTSQNDEQEADWSTVKKKAQNNGQQDKTQANTGSETYAGKRNPSIYYDRDSRSN